MVAHWAVSMAERMAVYLVDYLVASSVYKKAAQKVDKMVGL